MEGDAYDLFIHIPVEEDPLPGAADALPVEQLIAKYDAKIRSAGAHIKWEEKLYSCRMNGRDEKVYANELKTLYLQVHPAEAQGIDRNPSLMQHFIRHLDDAEVAAWVRARQPATFDEAVTYAENMASVLKQRKTHNSPLGAIPTESLNQISNRNQSNNRQSSVRLCFNCNSPSHLIRDCPTRNSRPSPYGRLDNQDQKNNSSSKQPSGNKTSSNNKNPFKRPRGRGKGRRGGSNSPQRNNSKFESTADNYLNQISHTPDSEQGNY